MGVQDGGFLIKRMVWKNRLMHCRISGLLSRFVGMLTDSRSFLSYTRHEYFRRTLCNILGNDVENGEIPNDMELLGQMVENISFNNAKKLFPISKNNTHLRLLASAKN